MAMLAHRKDEFGGSESPCDIVGITFIDDIPAVHQGGPIPSGDIMNASAKTRISFVVALFAAALPFTGCMTDSKSENEKVKITDLRVNPTSVKAGSCPGIALVVSRIGRLARPPAA